MSPHSIAQVQTRQACQLDCPCHALACFRQHFTGMPNHSLVSDNDSCMGKHTVGGSSSCDSTSVSCLTSLAGRPGFGALGAAGALCFLGGRPPALRPFGGSGRARNSSCGRAAGFSGIQKPLLVVWPMPVPWEPRSQPYSTNKSHTALFAVSLRSHVSADSRM